MKIFEPIKNLDFLYLLLLCPNILHSQFPCHLFQQQFLNWIYHVCTKITNFSCTFCSGKCTQILAMFFPMYCLLFLFVNSITVLLYFVQTIHFFTVPGMYQGCGSAIGLMRIMIRIQVKNPNADTDPWSGSEFKALQNARKFPVT